MKVLTDTTAATEKKAKLKVYKEQHCFSSF